MELKSELHVGQLVVYKHPYNDRCELGRVASITENGFFVCYSEGETAAKTPREYLFPVVNCADVDYSRIGGGRFAGYYHGCSL